MIRDGYAADLVVLSGDPFAVPPGAIDTIKVVETWSRGVRVFSQRTGEG
jgi:predicted amidohydrolase YtcJ